MASQTSLWKCPRCGHRFVTRNLWHACVRVPIADHFKGKPVQRRRTWDRWLAAARTCGRVEAYAQRSRLVIQSRVRFSGVVVRTGSLDAHLWLHRQVDHPRLRRVEDFGRLGFVHRFRLESPEDVDPALEELMREAYRAASQPRKPGPPVR